MSGEGDIGGASEVVSYAGHDVPGVQLCDDAADSSIPSNPGADSQVLADVPDESAEPPAITSGNDSACANQLNSLTSLVSTDGSSAGDAGASAEPLPTAPADVHGVESKSTPPPVEVENPASSKASEVVGVGDEESAAATRERGGVVVGLHPPKRPAPAYSFFTKLKFDEVCTVLLRICGPFPCISFQ